MAEIVFENVSKTFGNIRVIENLNLTVRDGTFTVLLGPSGCGKTTLLRMIAGIGPATEGKIFMDGEDISHVPPGKRNVAMVFQNYAIYPTMSVKENIAFCLKNNRVPKAEREERIARVARTVGLEEYLDRKPAQLSGGQRQRVALARAMVKEPAVFLMDEPLSNLDAKLRSAMRSELIQLHRQLKTTFVYVTHDQVESMAMADHIVLMDQGKIMQEGPPETIYREPENVFTARFIGTPPTNILDTAGGRYRIGFRPENVQMAGDSGKGYGQAVSGENGDFAYQRNGKILTREMLGSEVLYKVAVPEGDIMVKSLCFSHKEGETVSVRVRMEHLYFFDPSGMRIRDHMEDVRKGLQQQ